MFGMNWGVLWNLGPVRLQRGKSDFAPHRPSDGNIVVGGNLVAKDIHVVSRSIGHVNGYSIPPN